VPSSTTLLHLTPLHVLSACCCRSLRSTTTMGSTTDAPARVAHRHHHSSFCTGELPLLHHFYHHFYCAITILRLYYTFYHHRGQYHHLLGPTPIPHTYTCLPTNFTTGWCWFTVPPPPALPPAPQAYHHLHLPAAHFLLLHTYTAGHTAATRACLHCTCHFCHLHLLHFTCTTTSTPCREA